MELTKEYFDQAIKGLASREELHEAVAPLVTKEDLKEGLAASEKRVIKRIDDAQEDLARMVSSGFEDLQNRLDVTAQIKTFERKFKKLEEALHITL